MQRPERKVLQEEVSKSGVGQKSLIVECPSFFHSMASPAANLQKKISFAIE